MKKKTHKLQQRWQQFLRTDRALLFLCMFVSFLFWVVVKLSKPYTSQHDYAIEWNMPDQRAFHDPPPTTISANVTGSGWDHIRMSLSRLNPIVLNVPDHEKYSISSSSLRLFLERQLPSELEVEDIQPDYISGIIDSLHQKKVPLRNLISVQTAAQHALMDSVRLQPDSVTIIGPMMLLQSLTEWQTVQKKYPNLQSSTHITVPLQSSSNPQVWIQPEKVQAVVNIEKTTERSFFVPISVKNPPTTDSLRIFPSNVKVSSRVGLSDLQDVSADNFKAWVDLAGIQPGDEKNKATIEVSVNNKRVISFRYAPHGIEFYAISQDMQADD